MKTNGRPREFRLIGVGALVWMAFIAEGVGANEARSQSAPPREKIIIDTDIGDDIDDAFVVALALKSPEFNILGITTAYGDTETRAKILDRMLGEAGRQQIPVAVGIHTPLPEWYTYALSQRRYGDGGQRFARATHPEAITFILDQIRRYPGQVTLVAIGPMSNIGALIDRDIETFRKLKQVVIMGCSIGPIKPDYGDAPTVGPMADWNIVMDIPAAQKLFTSGVTLYVMPVDATLHLKLDDIRRSSIFAHGTALTDALTLLYHQWSSYDAGGIGLATPVLHDSLTLSYLLEPSVCPVQAMHLHIDDKGFTRVDEGKPNANVCMHSDVDAFMNLQMSRLLSP